MEQHHRPIVDPGDELRKSGVCRGLLVVVPIHIGKAPKHRLVAQLLGIAQIVLAVDPLGWTVVFGHFLAGDAAVQCLQVGQLLGKVLLGDIHAKA